MNFSYGKERKLRLDKFQDFSWDESQVLFIKEANCENTCGLFLYGLQWEYINIYGIRMLALGGLWCMGKSLESEKLSWMALYNFMLYTYQMRQPLYLSTESMPNKEEEKHTSFTLCKHATLRQCLVWMGYLYVWELSKQNTSSGVVSSREMSTLVSLLRLGK